jgi:hypothetical protein
LSNLIFMIVVPRTKIIGALALALVASGSAFAKDNNVLVIKGKVIGDNGKPQPDAEIRVKRVDSKAPEVVAVTD